MTGGFFIHVPGIIGSISGEMCWEVGKSKNGLIIEWMEIGDVTLVEGQGVFGKDDITIVRRGSGSNAGAIAPDELFFLGCLVSSACS